MEVMNLVFLGPFRVGGVPLERSNEGDFLIVKELLLKGLVRHELGCQ